MLRMKALIRGHSSCCRPIQRNWCAAVDALGFGDVAAAAAVVVVAAAVVVAVVVPAAAAVAAAELAYRAVAANLEHQTRWLDQHKL